MARRTIHIYRIEPGGEMAAFSSIETLKAYLLHWHLSAEQLEMLIDDGFYEHGTLGIITYDVITVDAGMEELKEL